MKHIAVGLVLASVFLASGCGKLMHLTLGDGIQGSGKSKTESRNVGSFKSIALSGSPDVRWKRAATTSVSVKGDDNLLKHLITKVEGGTLKIYFDTNVSTRAETVITIASPVLEAASVTGSGDMELSGIESNQFDAAVTGSGDLSATGRAASLKATVTGSGNLDFTKVSAKTASASITGSGDILVNVAEKLSAAISGSGDISYLGNPKVTESVMGSGEIHRIR